LVSEFPTVTGRAGKAVEARYPVERLPAGHKTAASIPAVDAGIDLFNDTHAAR